MLHIKILIQLSITILLVFNASGNLADDSEWRFTTSGKVVSVGDIHGDYDAFVAIMEKAQLLDSETNWIGKNTHFVSTGDFLDRGPDSRKLMDLFIKLEGQASDAGGKVHVLLGNHEVMNLIGDRRYVSTAEYAAFQSEASANQRIKQYQYFLKTHTLLDNSKAQARFDKYYPLGYFGLHAGFKANGFYGRWLKDKPFIIIINKQLFVHGGLPKAVAELGLSGVNEMLNKEMNDYARLWYALIDDGLFHPYYYREDMIEIAGALVEGRLQKKQFQTKAIVRRAKLFLKVADSIINNSEGPIWYRGTALCHQYSEEPLVNKVLTKLGANSAYLGHSVTRSREVESRFNGRVFLQDTGMLKKSYGGQSSLVIHTAAGVQVLDQKHGLHDIKEQPPRLWDRPYRMTTDELEDFLLTAKVIASEEIGLGVSKPLKLTLKKGKRSIHAIYKNIDTDKRLEKAGKWSRMGNYADRYHHEIAAYKLNKMLELDIIPPTVIRAFNGKRGIFQYWIENGINQTKMKLEDISYAGVCSKKSQKDLMRIFDALIYNDDRNTGNIFYQKDKWQIWLIDHTRAFRTRSTLPAGLKWSKLRLSDNLRQRFAALNISDLNQNLSKYLHRKQLIFLLKRRDNILSKVVN